MRISTWLYLLEQTLCSLCLLLTLGIAAELPRKSWPRLLATSVMAGAVTLSAMHLPSVWLRAGLILPLSALSPPLAWPGIPKRLRGRMAALSVMLGMLFSGAMRMAAPLALPALLILPLACLALVALPRFAPRPAELPHCATVEIRHGSSRLTLTALIDSGNLLRDAITGLPVILISRRAAARLLPSAEESAPAEMLSPTEALTPGMRLMSVRTVSGTSLMTIFRPDSVLLLSGNAWKPVRSLIGLSPDGYDGFQALVPATLLASSALHTDQVLSQGG